MPTDTFFRPVSGFDLPRFAGVPTFMPLPHVPIDHPRFSQVQIGLIGAPGDGGTTNRPGPRHGPRQLRDLSTMIREQNGATWVAPFDPSGGTAWLGISLMFDMLCVMAEGVAGG